MAAIRKLLALTILLLPLNAQPATDSSELLIVHVTVIDGSGAPPRPDMTVQLQDGRIQSLTASGEHEIPASPRVIDGRGKFLIPGLWDMHVHMLRKGRPEAYFPLLIANGITGIRDMGGDMPFAEINRLRDEIAAGTRLGPRIFAPGPLLDGPYPTLPGITRVVRNADEAYAAVVDLKQQGADFIKVYNRLPREAYFTLAATAKAQGIPFAGHVPYAVSAREASNEGQKSFEHLFNILFACSDRENELMSEKARALASDDIGERTALRQQYLQTVLQSYNPEKARALFALFAKNGTWQTPTLIQRRAYVFPPTALADDPRMRLIPLSLRWRWDPKQDGRIQGRSAEWQEIERRFYDKDRALIAPMRSAGVRFLAGTDSPDGFAFPGFSLHEELAQLVDAGLTPMEALQAATRNAADYFGLTDTGIIAPQKRADLVLLDSDPLTDIRNTQRIAAVVVGGRYLSREMLQRMLDDAAIAAAKN
jgi:imidazolonepropionase-like amidohydrolase